MNAKEIKDFEKKDIYTTQTLSVDNFNGFLAQCKRAINKLYGYKVSTQYDFWSSDASRELKLHALNVIAQLPREEATEEYNNIVQQELTYWTFLRKYGYLSVEDGYLCIDFEFNGCVFAAYSSHALIEMGVYTSKEITDYINSIC